jgi:alkaline phosphatase
MKSQKIKSIALLLTALLSCASLAGCQDYTMKEDNEIKNVILIIGDGMGENHLENALTYFELDKPSFYADRVGSIATRSADNVVTDSAAAGTALATGKKVNNGEIARHNGKDLTSISQLALEAGKRVGVVTTDTLDGATPSTFSAHADNRDNSYDIISSQAVSGINLLMGRSSSDYTYNQELFTENGYAIVSDPAELGYHLETEKLIATFSNIQSEYAPYCENDFQLKQMAEFAIQYLDNDEGYFLMIEGAYIDKYSHNKNIEHTLCEVRSLIDTVEYLYGAVGNDTAIIVTADHETGQLDKAETREDIRDTLYHSKEHTNRDVPLFAHNFTLECKKVPQNTAIFDICKKLLGI